MLVGMLLCLCLLAVGRVAAYSGGPPLEACDDMLPAGHGVPAQTSPSPYSFVLPKGPNEYTLGRKLTVTLQGTKEFKGVFIQARSVTTGKRVGSFGSPPDGLKLRQCTEGVILYDAVSHSKPLENTKSVAVEWIAPATDQGELFFIATAVLEKEVFWMNVTSEHLTAFHPDPK